ncbi:DNA topoisomerase I, putative [Perkinsus marinus ATCC 50983]|uniref:DNA topoisomerase I n=1 Tax=Perkinsus marinus (strain ATCC 50983 / TXsc) TaxID=423536 RepID=C5L755_PERM5|nr:DNA topoisomerase I, putative [Perkinsus marinus ATCC 50983]EER07317.1 DNA topoisomerase I, putative [Perkinsus marinus ATCC 50983]|eukprot:XP_002775501.1 DNA topoisomerase I, putative [Perkinsus marinus ATCC 50983]
MGKDDKVKKEKKEKKEKKVKKEKKEKKDKKEKSSRKAASSSTKATTRKPRAKKEGAEEKVATGGGRKRKAIVRTEDDFEPFNRWWEKDPEDNAAKWSYLEHHGMIFTPPYEPHGVKMLYKGEPIDLPPEAEEVATFFAQTLGTDWCQKEKFQNNFWADFQAKLPKELKSKITKLKDCDFEPIKNYLDKRSEAKKARTKEEKEAEKEAKRLNDHPYTHVIVDELRERVGNFRVEPPNLFRGRGDHPKMGKLKQYILPEDVTVNCAADAPAPRCPVPGHAYKDVVHDPAVTWLAWFTDTINNQVKYVFLNAASGFKGQSDWLKYEKARKLKKYIRGIRDDYTKKMKSTDDDEKELGTAVYLIDRLALRVGNEKNTEEEADTVGCCSLRVEHMTFEADNKITLDFLGKDSIRYLNTVQVDPLVYKNLKALCKARKPEDMIFSIDPSKVNDYFKQFMQELSAKVFRTYNASITLEQELCKFDPEEHDISDPSEMVKFYNDANRRVAILCNHQRAPPKQHEAGMERLKKKLADQEATLRGLEGRRDELLGKTVSKDVKEIIVEKKLEKSNNMDSLVRKIKSQKLAAERTKIQIADKEDNKTVSLTTSKINYMDPRISVAFCKSHDCPIEKIFAKTIRNKFPWAMHSKSTWRF